MCIECDISEIANNFKEGNDHSYSRLAKQVFIRLMLLNKAYSEVMDFPDELGYNRIRNSPDANETWQEYLMTIRQGRNTRLQDLANIHLVNYTIASRATGFAPLLPRLPIEVLHDIARKYVEYLGVLSREGAIVNLTNPTSGL